MVNKIIPLDEPVVGDKEIEYLTKCIRSGWISWQGEFVSEFENQFARYCGTQYAMSICNGTTALILGLKALGIGAGDEVIVPTFTFSASVWAINVAGAVPVFADSLPGKFTMDPADIESRITGRTKAIMVVHLYGRPVDMDPVIGIARAHGLKVVEDAAEAPGAIYRGRKVGSIGDIGCFSFHNKLIATGEGGAITTNDRALLDQADALRNPAPDNRTTFPEISLNCRMSNIQAAVALAQIERLEEIIAKKRWIAASYEKALGAHNDVVIVAEESWARSVYWRYSILLRSGSESHRDAVVAALNEKGIRARAVFLPMHVHLYHRQSARASFPCAEAVSRCGIDLPSSPKLGTEELHHVTEALSDVLAGFR